MGILRKLGATTTAVALLGVGVLTAGPATAAQAAPAVAPKVAPKATAPQPKAPAAKKPAGKNVLVPGKLRLDKRCMTGRIICMNKKTRKLAFLYNGKLLATGDVRFGGPRTPTRNGSFKVYRKSKNHVSSIYKSPMPYAMFFSGGQAVHYSADFKARGYNGASHGCANMRDKKKIAWIFARVKIGDKVLVYNA
ncbi:ErfK/YbiS/YcfS/YnhG family protein [Kribbella flavida DSM 17836]|uniref:ErfK/YbiS/YcfS/YnhG family protein n=1 Tax=Kribbella flavida (strain DSM 17836 / JCM 10339 / NBRC 14399) TaxID=479435 RepID=D2Q1C0_KRIFD|nr:L,D-transpeptidase [Kribbella flavida]ADB30108.1 ErfK/YbiS/YcfS/YnhG family protein [Kribbella flavida DSM 17836]